MTQMTERAAEGLAPGRAGELVRVLDLQARWENMRAGSKTSTGQLHELQKAFEAYRASRAAYTGRGSEDQVPELTPSGPDRLGRWCRTVRAVCRRADPGCGHPAHVLAKVYHLADRIAVRVRTAPPGRGEPPTDMAGAVRQLGEIVAWCDALVADPSPASEGGGSHEVGGSGGSRPRCP